MRVRSGFIGFLLCIALPCRLEGQGSLQLSATRLPDLAGELLLDDELRHRDVPRPVTVASHIYLMRLYEVGEIGGCEGTDQVCRRRYALLIATGGLPGAVALYDLGSVGEITEIVWVSSPPPRVISENPRMIVPSDEATVLVTVQNFPTSILEGQPLTRQTKRYRLTVSLERTVVENLP